jgi:hypothetical protein
MLFPETPLCHLRRGIVSLFFGRHAEAMTFLKRGRGSSMSRLLHRKIDRVLDRTGWMILPPPAEELDLLPGRIAQGVG